MSDEKRQQYIDEAMAYAHTHNERCAPCVWWVCDFRDTDGQLKDLRDRHILALYDEIERITKLHRAAAHRQHEGVIEVRALQERIAELEESAKAYSQMGAAMVAGAAKATSPSPQATPSGSAFSLHEGAGDPHSVNASDTEPQATAGKECQASPDSHVHDGDCSGHKPEGRGEV